jgi:DNA-binding IclR family transcriptional regulator
MGVASGLKNGDGNTVGAICVVGYLSRLSYATLESIAKHVKAYALQISRELGNK